MFGFDTVVLLGESDMGKTLDLLDLLVKEGLKLDLNVENEVYRIQGPISPNLFAMLDQLPTLKNLLTLVPAWPVKSVDELRQLSVHDDDLEVLTRCPQLHLLHLRDSIEVGDAGLIHLRNLIHLWSLTLPPKVTDEGLRHLDSLAGLRNLEIRSCQATGTGLKFLRDLPLLEHVENWIEKWQGDVSDEAIEAMVTLPHILRLFLTGSDIKDDSLRHLANSKSLQQLFLDDTSITDNAVEYLLRAPHIKGLWVARSNVTPAGVAKLRAGLPNTKIYGGTDDDPPQ